MFSFVGVGIDGVEFCTAIKGQISTENYWQSFPVSFSTMEHPWVGWKSFFKKKTCSTRLNSSVVICPLATIWITHLGVKLFISHRIWLLDLLYSFRLNVHVSLISFFKCIFQKKSITSFGSIVLLIHSHNGNSCKRSPFNLLASFFLNASPQIYFIPQQLFIYSFYFTSFVWVGVCALWVHIIHAYIHFRFAYCSF